MEPLLLSAVTLSASLALFVAIYKLVQYEHQIGKRVVLSKARSFLDGYINRIVTIGSNLHRRLIAMNLLTRETKPDGALASVLFSQATKTPLTVQHTKNHLSQIREHKTETALTPAQGRKLRKKKLEERF